MNGVRTSNSSIIVACVIVLVTPSASDDEVKGDHHPLSRRSTAIIDKTYKLLQNNQNAD